MTDVHNKATRSYNMSRIKGKDTKPEMLVRRFLYSQGFRFKLHLKTLIGKPDIVLSKYKTIVDIRGCFWHGHENCKFGDKIHITSEHYQKRILDAKSRDIINLNEWIAKGWKVQIIWAECELEPRKKKSEIREKTLSILIKNLLQNPDM